MVTLSCPLRYHLRALYKKNEAFMCLSIKRAGTMKGVFVRCPLQTATVSEHLNASLLHLCCIGQESVGRHSF